MTPPTWLEHVTGVAERGRAMLGRAAGGTHGTGSLAVTCDRLIARRGEASGLALAAEVVHALERMSNAETAEFLEVLADRAPLRPRRSPRQWRAGGRILLTIQ